MKKKRQGQRQELKGDQEMSFLFREKPLGNRHQQQKEKEETIKKRKERPNKLSYSTNQGILH